MNIELRTEQTSDYRETDFVTREAFWNYYSPGCNEHYLLHIMRDSTNSCGKGDFLKKGVLTHLQFM